MKYEITINYTTTIEADDEQEAMEEIIMNYTVDKHDIDIHELNEDIELTYNQEHKEEQNKESEE
tara:strand:+ start:328 stop:519 length:192 start_codon:yes stop_codon:yes gene_type:complete